MENNEIMVNEEVMENVAEVATVDSNPGNGWKAVVGIGVAVLAVVAGCKIVKKIRANVQAKKEEQLKAIEVDFDEEPQDNDFESREETEEI